MRILFQSYFSGEVVQIDFKDKRVIAASITAVIVAAVIIALQVFSVVFRATPNVRSQTNVALPAPPTMQQTCGTGWSFDAKQGQCVDNVHGCWSGRVWFRNSCTVLVVEKNECDALGYTYIDGECLEREDAIRVGICMSNGGSFDKVARKCLAVRR